MLGRRAVDEEGDCAFLPPLDPPRSPLNVSTWHYDRASSTTKHIGSGFRKSIFFRNMKGRYRFHDYFNAESLEDLGRTGTGLYFVPSFATASKLVPLST